jgi:hypothetical protein
MSKTLTKIRLAWTNEKTPLANCSCTYDAAELGPTVARQRAASRAAVVFENGGVYVATEYYSDGSKHEFKNI